MRNRTVRLAYRDGMSARGGASWWDFRGSVRKMRRISVPPGYRRTAPIRRPKFGGVSGLIDQWLCGDRTRPHKLRHAAKRVFDRHRSEYGFGGSYTIAATRSRLTIERYTG